MIMYMHHHNDAMYLIVRPRLWFTPVTGYPTEPSCFLEA